MTVLEKKFTNSEQSIELISYIDARQNIWFRGNDIAKSWASIKPGTRNIPEHAGTSRNMKK